VLEEENSKKKTYFKHFSTAKTIVLGIKAVDILIYILVHGNKIAKIVPNKKRHCEVINSC